jgi:hypothetical protein
MRKRGTAWRIGGCLAVSTVVNLSSLASAAVTLSEKDNFQAYFSGYTALDMFSDTTEGIDEIVGSPPVARPRTVAGCKPIPLTVSRPKIIGCKSQTPSHCEI